MPSATRPARLFSAFFCTCCCVIAQELDCAEVRLLETFGFGITDAGFNSPCIDSGGSPIADPTLVSPAQCAAAGLEPNTSSNPDVTGTPFSAALLGFDLTRGGSPFAFHATQNINQFAGYAIAAPIVGGMITSTIHGADPRSGVLRADKRTTPTRDSFTLEDNR